ncbi:MAG: DUF349 domain-containing protein [Weeksellaceae bacterium]|nr:DUF349 domain-containing protein [Weeksellaceae bacterium]
MITENDNLRPADGELNEENNLDPNQAQPSQEPQTPTTHEPQEPNVPDTGTDAEPSAPVAPTYEPESEPNQPGFEPDTSADDLTHIPGFDAGDSASAPAADATETADKAADGVAPLHESQDNADAIEQEKPETGVELQATETGSSHETEPAEAAKVPADKDYNEVADEDQHADENEEEDEEEHEVEEKDYESMTVAQLLTEGASLMAAYAPFKIKSAFNKIKDAIRHVIDTETVTEREKHVAQGLPVEDFHYNHPYRADLSDLNAQYKRKVDDHYRKVEEEQKLNLEKRMAIIEELKALYTEPSESNSDLFRKFRNLKTRWHEAGRIPRVFASNVFKTYYHHLDNFNEFLDLNHELRKMDYEHNLEVRKSIIEQAKQLLEEESVQKALNELQYLHRMWKEEAVPVAEEHRETTWQEFKAITSQIHDRKIELSEQARLQQEENLHHKREIIGQINNLLVGQTVSSHGAWQRKIKELNQLRETFFALGRVPKDVNQEVWNEFKEAMRSFNHEKNTFYKNMKDEQNTNLEKKRELVKIATEHRDSTDWNESVKVVKRIQSEWKKIGHVPRKYSDKIWKEFSEANNTFFERYKNRNNEKLESQNRHLEDKKALLAEMRSAEKPKEKEALLDWLNQYSLKWAAIGFVPNGKQGINKEFSQLNERILEEAGFDKHAMEDAKWQNQIGNIKQNLDERALRILRQETRKEIDEVQKEVTQLQTNLSFFANADENNPLFKNAISNIENKVSELKSLENKLEDLKHINLEALAEAQKQAQQAQADTDAAAEGSAEDANIENPEGSSETDSMA